MRSSRKFLFGACLLALGGCAPGPGYGYDSAPGGGYGGYDYSYAAPGYGYESGFGLGFGFGPWWGGHWFGRPGFDRDHEGRFEHEGIFERGHEGIFEHRAHPGVSPLMRHRDHALGEFRGERAGRSWVAPRVSGHPGRAGTPAQTHGAHAHQWGHH